MAHYEINKTFRFALRGFQVRTFRKGEIYELPDEVEAFVQENDLGREVEAPDDEGAKMLRGAPQNKVLEGPPGNKGSGGRGGSRTAQARST